MTFSIKTRKNTVDKLKNEELDLLVIGGGITGAGVALQATASGLKTLEVGYTLPESWTKKAYISSARVYCSGNNLLLLSGFKLWDIEMGGSGLGYPIQRVINLGVQINF